MNDDLERWEGEGGWYTQWELSSGLSHLQSLVPTFKSGLMRDSKRIPGVLQEVQKIWEKYPDLRLSQLILNLHPQASALYFIEDEELVKALKEYYGNLAG